MTLSKGKRLKVAVLIKRFITTGGAERYCYEVTRRIAREHQVHVFAHEWDYNHPESIVFHKIPNPVIKPRWLNQWLFSKFSREAIKDKGFDIIHSHEKVSNFHIMTVHSPCFKSILTRSNNSIKRFVSTVGVLLSPRKLAWLLLEESQFRGKNKFYIAVSKNIRENVTKNYDIPTTSFTIAYPGVDFCCEKSISEEQKIYLKKSFGIEPGDIVFLFVGNEFKRKGLGPLLKAFSMLEIKGPRLVVVGDGGGRLEQFKRLSRELGLQERVVFLGLVRDMVAVYSMSDAFILPTLSDPFGMAVLEAMSFGLPVAVSNSKFCGAAECIKEGALIINNPLDQNEILESIRLLLNLEVRARLSKMARAEIQSITWENTASQTIYAYDKVIKNGRIGTSYMR